jgi:tetratricopeptide (TPR) repeat protein
MMEPVTGDAFGRTLESLEKLYLSNVYTPGDFICFILAHGMLALVRLTLLDVPLRALSISVRVFGIALLLCSFDMISGQESAPASADTQIAAGIEALKAGHLDTAEKIFKEALGRGVRKPLVLHNLGVIAQERGDHQLAVRRFREVISLQPDYGPARLLLGSSLLALGKNQAAITELKLAVKLIPDQAAARLELAKAYEASEEWIEAVDVLQKLVVSIPDNAEYSYQLGKALAKLSGWSLQEIARLNPNSVRLHQALGQEYAIQGKYDRALIEYQEAARSAPTLPEIHLGTALILLELKRFDEALAEDEMELKLVPESKIAAETKVKIEAAKAAAAP